MYFWKIDFIGSRKINFMGFFLDYSGQTWSLMLYTMIKVNRPDTPMTIYFLSCNTGLTLAMLYVIQAVIWWRLSAILCCLFCLRPAGISCSTTWHRCNTWERLKVKIISKDAEYLPLSFKSKINNCELPLQSKWIHFFLNDLCIWPFDL